MRRFALLLIFVALALPAVIVAQQVETSSPLRVEITGANAANLPELILSANVYNSSGQAVVGLTEADFTITGSAADFIDIISVESILDDNLPFATVLVIDVSTSMTGTPIARARDAARGFVESLRGEDPVAIMTFGSNVELIQDFTTDRAALLAAIDSIDAGGETALYQGSFDAVDIAANAPVPRRAIILLSDGAEFGGQSAVTAQQAAGAALDRSVPVFTIGLGFGTDRGFLETIAGVSSGQYFESPTPEELEGIYQRLATLFTSQYVLTLNADVPLDGTVYDITLNATSGENTASATTIFRAPIPVPIVEIVPPDVPDTDGDGLVDIAEPYTFMINVFADDEIETAVFTYNNETFEMGLGTEIENGRRFTLAVDPLSRQPGPDTVGLTVTDSNGDTGSAFLDYSIAALPSIVDILPPLSSLGEIAEPTAITLVISGQTEPETVTYSIHAAEPQPIEPPYVITIDPINYEPGPQSIDISVINAGGVETTISDTFSVASLPPIITVNGLAEGDTIAGPTDISVEYVSQSPVIHVAIFVDGFDLAHLFREPYTATIDPIRLRLAPGSHTLLIVADNATGGTANVRVNFNVAASIGMTQTALAPTATFTPTPTPTFTASPDPVIITATAAAQAQIAAEGTANAVATSSAASTAAAASTQGAVAAQSTTVALTQQTGDEIATATASSAQATLGAQQTATLRAQGTLAAQNTLSAQSTEAAQVTQAAAAQNTAAARSTANAQATLAAQNTLEAQNTAAAQSTLDAQATQAALATTTAAVAAENAATASAMQTVDARSTAQIIARTQVAEITRDAIATSNAGARQNATATADARQTQRAESTAASIVAATAQAEANATATQIIAQIREQTAAAATQTAQAEANATLTAEASFATQTAIADSLAATATTEFIANSTAEAIAQQTANAQATLDARASATADAQATISAQSTADALATREIQLAAVGLLTGEPSAEPTEEVTPTAIDSVAQAATTDAEPSPQPTLVDVEAPATSSPSDTDTLTGILVLCVLIVVALVIIYLILLVINRVIRRNNAPPR